MKKSYDLGLLMLRLGMGGAMLTHGIPKLMKIVEGDMSFGDPLGVGPTLSLILTVFAEFLCSVLIIIGLKTRLATIPLIITMLVAFFMVHGADDFATKEKAFLYLAGYLALAFMGAGKFSVDRK